MKLIEETGYENSMKTVVLPYLEERKRSGDFERIPNQKIFYRIYTADQPHADLVLVHGFTEGIDKFNEVIYYFLQEGFSVWQIQQRGHGKSFRSVLDPSLVHIGSYKDLLEDLHYFVTEIVKKERKDPALPLDLFGHSMGGGVSAAYLGTWPDDFSKAILTSPMLQMDSGAIPLWLASVYGRIMVRTGHGEKYMPSTVPFSKEPDFENSCSNCKARYLYWFHQACERQEYQTNAPSIRTALEFLLLTEYATAEKNCAKVKADVLLLQAGRDHMVKPGGQEKFIRQIKEHGKLLRIETAKHEIYMCTNAELEKYWEEIMKFLQP